jgi:hypothetical protein
LKTARQGFQIEEIPVESSMSAEGTFDVWAHGPEVLIKTFQLYLRLMLKGA